jgi:hypothetical protein
MTKGGDMPTGKQAAFMRMYYRPEEGGDNSHNNSDHDTPEEGGWRSESDAEPEVEVEVEVEEEEKANKPPPKKKAKRVSKKLLADYHRAIDDLLETGCREDFIEKFPPTKQKTNTSAVDNVKKPKSAWLYYYDEKKVELKDIPQTAVGLTKMIAESWEKVKNKPKSKWGKLSSDDKNRYYDELVAADPDFVRPKEKEAPGHKAMYFQHLRDSNDPRIQAVTDPNERKKMFFQMWNQLPREDKNNWLVKCGTKRKREEEEENDDEE